MGGERTQCSNPTNDFKTGCWLNDAAKGQGDPRLLSSFQLAEGQTGRKPLSITRMMNRNKPVHRKPSLRQPLNT